MRGMNKKTINNVIKRKVDAWLETIEDESLRADCKRDVIVTGGCIASMLLGEDVNDYDIYFKTYKTTVRVAEHYLAQFIDNRVATQGGVAYSMVTKELEDSQGRNRVRIVVKSAGIAGEGQKKDYQYFEGSRSETAEEYVQEAFAGVDEEVKPEKPDYHPVFLSSNAITLKGGVQLIIRFFGPPEAIHENFDFVHCMNYWTREEKVVVNTESLEALMSRTLVYKGSLYPIASVFRTKKFIERDWKINAGQYLKMILQIGELDLKDFNILEEQLTGVDVAYFHEVLSLAQDKENPLVVETAYLAQIVERMFG